MEAKKTILLIEDEPDFSRIYGDLFKSKGYKILTAADGLSGWEAIKRNLPDLVLLDLILPGEDGFKVLQRIRGDEQTKQIPVIIFSVMGSGDNVQKALSMGANDYTVKGYYRPEEILAKIQNLLTSGGDKTEPKSYLIKVEDDSPDGIRLREDMGLGHGFECPECKTPMQLKLMTDNTREQGHWFVGHFWCRKCSTLY